MCLLREIATIDIYYNLLHRAIIGGILILYNRHHRRDSKEVQLINKNTF